MAMVKSSPSEGTVSRWKRLPTYLLSLPLRLWWKTLSIRIAPSCRRLVEGPGPFIIALWHCELFVIGEIHRRIFRDRPLAAMVSSSRDGEWLAELLRQLGIRSVRGSSRRGALRVYGEALRHLRRGWDLAITPDGPVGPRCRCKLGTIHLALKSSLPIVAVSIRYGAALRLSSWDHMRLPLPFSRIAVDFSYLEPEELARLPSADAQRQLLEQRLSRTHSS
ncbi:MAG: lysophospholipid acyltransferase family protein [Puniceicoccales bacterium]|jgi:lysophospholipid acyltransferase (LPLAT)-like uncharacterized protein|nr:lysophospholipid acyltransferase family protein [Puniceicoccales bacterium]